MERLEAARKAETNTCASHPQDGFWKRKNEKNCLAAKSGDGTGREPFSSLAIYRVPNQQRTSTNGHGLSVQFPTTCLTIVSSLGNSPFSSLEWIFLSFLKTSKRPSLKGTNSKDLIRCLPATSSFSVKLTARGS
jgi:hypothetical protein